MYAIPIKNHFVRIESPTFEFAKFDRFLIKVLVCAIAFDIIAWGFFLRFHFFSGTPLPAIETVQAMSSDARAEQFAEQIRNTGRNATYAGPVTRKSLTGKGSIITMEKDNLLVFMYNDQITAQKEAATLAEKYLEYPAMDNWGENVHLYADPDTAVFYMGDDENILDSLNKVDGLSRLTPVFPFISTNVSSEN